MADLHETLHATLKDLVAIDSTSSRPNAPVIDYLELRLAAAGFACERHAYADEAGVQKTNLVAVRGTLRDDRAELALVGHTDCVPYDAGWKEALQLTERDGKLFGRGSCDTKAFVACALIAAERVRTHARPLMAVFTADEEVGCYGAKRLVEVNAGRARHAIVGEPTSLTPIRAHKGYALAEIEVKGIEGHSAYPESGASAIFRAGRFLEKLERLGQTVLRSEQDGAFSPPYTTVNVGMISGGKAKNIIPGSCKFIVEWRPIPSQPVGKVPELLEQLRAELVKEEPAYEAQIRLLRGDRGVDTSPEAPVVRWLVEQSGNTSATVAFGTEAPQLTQLGAEAVVFGPGDIRNAHRTGEFVPIPELHRCEEILERAIHHFCG